MLEKSKDLARAVGCTERFIHLIWSGKKKPGLEMAKRLEKATGVPRLAWLYPDEFDNPYVQTPP